MGRGPLGNVADSRGALAQVLPSFSVEVGLPMTEVLPACRAAIKLYPFASLDAPDMTVLQYQGAFGPAGSINLFLDNDLAPYVDRSGKTWRPRAGNSVADTLSSSSMAALQLADNIWKGTYLSRYIQGALGFPFRIQTVSVGPGVASVRLNIGSSQTADLSLKDAIGEFDWVPTQVGTDGATLTITPKDTAIAPIVMQLPGPWAIFRLLDKGKCQPCTAKKRNYTYGEDDLAVTINVTAPTAPASGDPFDKTKLWKLKCPPSL